MDIIGGLTAASQAIGIVKELRSIDRSVDDSVFKLKLAELQSALADAKIALSDARLEIDEKDWKIRELERELSDALSGEVCGICRKGKMETEAVRPHPTHGIFGHQEHDLLCSECGHSEKRRVDRPGNERVKV